MKAKEFIPPSKPRNFVAKNQQTAGAGAHRDKKKEQKQGYEKHKGKLGEQTDTPEDEMDRTVSDLHKDVYGFRPNQDFGREWMAMSYEEKLKLYYSMIDQLDEQDVEEGYGDKRFEVNGYTYVADLDIEDDNRKIWHMIKLPDGKTVDVDFTPYSYMTKDDVELYVKLGMPKRQGMGPLDTKQLQKMAQIKGVAMLDPKMARAGMEERIRDPEDWDEGNTEPGNNFAVYINGKKWKVFPGPYAAYADSPEEQREFNRLKDMAARKSQQTGKKWEVYKTGEPATK